MKFAVTLMTALSLVFMNPAFAQEEAEPQGNPSREFPASCTYGVLAGTLVGAASLAFVDKPSDNLNRVARGASLGLYTGILLGLYVLYVVPGMESDPEEEEDPVARIEKMPVKVGLLFDSRDNPDGLQANWTFLRF